VIGVWVCPGESYIYVRGYWDERGCDSWGIEGRESRSVDGCVASEFFMSATGESRVVAECSEYYRDA